MKEFFKKQFNKISIIISVSLWGLAQIVFAFSQLFPFNGAILQNFGRPIHSVLSYFLWFPFYTLPQDEFLWVGDFVILPNFIAVDFYGIVSIALSFFVLLLVVNICRQKKWLIFIFMLLAIAVVFFVERSNTNICVANLQKNSVTGTGLVIMNNIIGRELLYSEKALDFIFLERDDHFILGRVKPDSEIKTVCKANNYINLDMHMIGENSQNVYSLLGLGSVAKWHYINPMFCSKGQMDERRCSEIMLKFGPKDGKYNEPLSLSGGKSIYENGLWIDFGSVNSINSK